MILSKWQAKSIYDAMLALNNIDAKLNAQFKVSSVIVSVQEHHSGYIDITSWPTGHNARFTNQEHFALSYELA